MTEYRRAKTGERSRIVEFINMVFTGTGTPHEFTTLLPKLYGEGKKTEDSHYLALEDGEIKAVVCAFPVVLRSGGKEITCATVGSVSVHPDSRGKGYMTRLMENAIEDMKEDQIAISCLTGMRRRYQHFGYEICGTVMEYRLSPASVHTTGDSDVIQPMLNVREVTSSDERIWDDMYELYHRQNCKAERSRRDFPDICRSWYEKVYAVLEGNRLAGYLTLKDRTICELILDREELLKPVLYTLFQYLGVDELYIKVYPYESQRIGTLSDCCERGTIHIDDNYRIFDYEKVLSFYLALKAEGNRLWDGELIVEIENHGCFCLEVFEGKAYVSTTDRAPEYTLTEFEAMALFFSPADTRIARRVQKSHRLNWFPLPLSMCWLDKC